MGSLITETPYSEITATLEILDHLGVGRDDLKKFRAADEEVQGQVAHILKNATSCTRISVTSQGAAPQQKPPALVLHKTTELGRVEGKKTNECFINDTLWYYRDGDIDHWLPPTQPAQSEGVVSVYQPQEEMTFRQMAAQAAQMPVNASLKKLVQALKERGHILTLADIDLLVAKQEGGEDVGLRTDGWANFAFVEDVGGSVSVLLVNRLDRGWRAGVYRLGYDGRWDAGDRLLLRNSVALAL